MQSVFDELYKNSLAKCEFKNLISIITTEENIRLAYRNLKKERWQQNTRYGWEKHCRPGKNERAGTDRFGTAEIQLVSTPVCQA